MKTALKIYIGISIFSQIVAVVTVCTTNLLIGLFMIPVAVLGVMLPFASLRCLEENEAQQAELYELRDRICRLEKQYPVDSLHSDIHDFVDGSFVSPPVMTAKHRWACAKCQTVNRAGTTVCENCGAHYSDEQTILYNAPLTRWKLKEEKKK